MTARKRSGRDPVERDAAWMVEFERQLAARDFGERMRVFARSRQLRLSKCFVLDELSVNQLVQDAIDDTYFGKRTWDPTRVDLGKHIMDVIRDRTRKRYRRRQRFHDISLDACGEAVQAEAAAQHDAYHEEEAALRTRADMLLAEYRELAADDREVLLLIDSYFQRIINKADVLRGTGLSARQYQRRPRAVAAIKRSTIPTLSTCAPRLEMLPTKDDKSIDAIDAIIQDAAELDAADPRNITAEDREWADAMRTRMKARIAEYKRSLLPPNDEPAPGEPIRPRFAAMARDALLATVHGIARKMGGQMAIANRKLTELSDDDLRRLLETLVPEDEKEEP
jgi:hypothetical protein